MALISIGGGGGGGPVQIVEWPEDPLAVSPTKSEVWSSLVLAILGLLLAKEAYDEFKEVTDDIEEIQERMLEMSRWMKDHALNVTHPFLNYAMNEAFNYPVDAPDYGGLCSSIGSRMLSVTANANGAASHYNRSFCMDKACNGQIGYYGGLATVDATIARSRSQERRRDRQEEAKVKTIQRAHTGTMRSPNAIFGLMDNAQSIYGALQQQAFGNLSGSLATFGYGIGGIASYFSGGTGKNSA